MEILRIRPKIANETNSDIFVRTVIKKVGNILLLCACVIGLSINSAVAQTAASEYEVKAAFLYNFIKFVDWPPRSFPQKDSPYVIGVLAEVKDDPFFDGKALTNYLDHAIEGKMINDRRLIARRSDRIEDLKDCHLVFIPKSERNHLKNILVVARANNILAVSETDDFCEQGGVINFIKQSGKVRFEINPAAAEQASLDVSSKLLNVAKIVRTQTR